MSSKRQLRRRSCGQRLRFDYRREATAVARGIRERSGGTNVMHAYRCHFCKCWHIGHGRAK